MIDYEKINPAIVERIYSVAYEMIYEPELLIPTEKEQRTIQKSSIILRGLPMIKYFKADFIYYGKLETKIILQRYSQKEIVNEN